MMSSKQERNTGSSNIVTRLNHTNITQPDLRNATSSFLIGPHCIGAKALETKWMNLADANLQYFAQVL